MLHRLRSVLVRPTLVVEDLESTNGTFINERRVNRAELAEGDRVRLGRVVFEVSKEA